jgi:hypothetical protein
MVWQMLEFHVIKIPMVGVLEKYSNVTLQKRKTQVFATNLVKMAMELDQYVGEVVQQEHKNVVAFYVSIKAKLVLTI